MSIWDDSFSPDYVVDGVSARCLQVMVAWCVDGLGVVCGDGKRVGWSIIPDTRVLVPGPGSSQEKEESFR